METDKKSASLLTPIELIKSIECSAGLFSEAMSMYIHTQRTAESTGAHPTQLPRIIIEQANVHICIEFAELFGSDSAAALNKLSAVLYRRMLTEATAVEEAVKALKEMLLRDQPKLLEGQG